MQIRKFIPPIIRRNWRGFKAKMKRFAKYSKPLDVFTYDKNLYWVDPRDIKYATKNGLHIIENEKKILKGNWDKLYIDFTALDVYISIRKRIEDGTSWRETPLYKRVFKEIEQGLDKWGCTTKEQKKIN